jgi:NAD(P)H-dependent FMN reductase
MKWLLLAASMRKESVNKKLLQITEEKIRLLGAETENVTFESIQMPLYNGDIEEKEGIPEGIRLFAEKIVTADAFVIASPEYNFSLPGTLKNLIDWLSRIKPLPFKGKRMLLLSASPSLVGGNRGLWALRVPLETCGAFVYPTMFSLSSAYEAFTESGTFVDAKNSKRLEALLKDFKDYL